MKKIAILLGLFLSASVYAENEKIPMERYVVACPLVYQLAEVVMQSRQMGMPLSEAIKPITGVNDIDVQELNKQIVISAYKVPIEHDDQAKQHIVGEFANAYALHCLESK